MLQLANGHVVEYPATAGHTLRCVTLGGDFNTITDPSCVSAPYLYWQQYPVYVCHDKTKKAIDILRALHSEKLIECKSVPKFIELVEKISNLL